MAFPSQKSERKNLQSVSELLKQEKTPISAKSVFSLPPDSLLLNERTELVGVDQEELVERLATINERSFRAKQLWHWIYHQGETDFSLMSSIAKPLQIKLSENFSINRPQVSLIQQSVDKTRKFLFRLSDGNEIETVYIPDFYKERGTVCISSQVGCTLTCSFCYTGTQKFVRNLSTTEIVSQFMALRDIYNEWPTPKGGTARILSNIVLMGMGEPLYNYNNIAKAVKIFTDGEGISLSRRRITLSTAGVVPMMDRAGAELGVNLAVSLHAVRDDLRDILVPINKKYPIADLMAACKRYSSASNARRITFEYVMIDSVNDSLTDAKELLRLIKGLPAKINLIPFNPWPGSNFKTSRPVIVKKFAEILTEAGYASPVRYPRGQDILAACGQLRTKSLRLETIKT